MKYLNQFHKETTERKLREMEEWKKQPFDCVAAAERSKQLVAEANRLDPDKKQKHDKQNLMPKKMEFGFRLKMYSNQVFPDKAEMKMTPISLLMDMFTK